LFSDSGEARVEEIMDESGAAGKEVIKSFISYSETRLNTEKRRL
jgi:hypothetical protein